MLIETLFGVWCQCPFNYDRLLKKINIAELHLIYAAPSPDQDASAAPAPLVPALSLTKKSKSAKFYRKTYFNTILIFYFIYACQILDYLSYPVSEPHCVTGLVSHDCIKGLVFVWFVL
jgi:hypothetical protein